MSLRNDYEDHVRALAQTAEQMRRDGADIETIARVLHAERRALAEKYKALTPEPMRRRIHDRTASVYDDPLGPTIDYLRAQGRSWDDIIESAMRPGPLP